MQKESVMTQPIATAKHDDFIVKTSLSTKLIFGIVAVLVVVITLLISSTVYILSEDKKAITYRMQYLESELITKEVTSAIKNGLEKL